MANKTRTAKRTPFFLALVLKVHKCYHTRLFRLSQANYW